MAMGALVRNVWKQFYSWLRVALDSAAVSCRFATFRIYASLMPSTPTPSENPAEPADAAPPDFVRTLEGVRAVWSYRQVAERSEAVRQELERRKIRLHRDSALGILLREAGALAKEWDEGSTTGDIRRLMSAAHANRVAGAVLTIATQPEAEECLRRMAGNDMNLSQRAPSRGKDALWELDLLSFLRRRGLQAVLREPDIVANFGVGDYPIACKKVYSEKGVEAQMRKGVQQLARFEGAGVVAFNIDDLVPADALMNSKTVQDASDFLAGLNKDFVDRHQRRLQRFVTEQRCDGILVAMTVLTDIAEGDSRFNNHLQVMLWTLEQASPSSRERVERLRLAISGL